MFLADHAIDHPREDLLGRGRLVDQVVRAVREWIHTSSLVVGIYGKWGEGKTSVRNLVRAELSKDDDLTVISIEPWYFNSGDALVRDFLAALLNALPSSKRKEMARTMETLRKFIASAPSVSILGFGANFAPLAPNEATLDSLSKTLTDGLSDLKRRLVITIDDLDRLDKADLAMMLKLVKLFSSLSQVVFVLTFDPEVVLRKMREESESDPKYLEKIIQVSIDLPTVDSATIAKFVDDRLEELLTLNNLQPEEDFSQRLSGMWREGISHFVRDLRTSKRYINGLAFTLPLVRGEVNYADFFAIEAIRLSFPHVYESIRRNTWSLTEGDWLPLPTEQLEKMRAEYFSLLRESISNDPIETRAVIEILEDLFPRLHPIRATPDCEHMSREMRITSKRCINRYFRWALAKDEMSDQRVQGLIAALNSSVSTSGELIQHAFAEARKEGLGENFLRGLRLFCRQFTKEAAIQVSAALAADRSVFSDDDKSLISSEFDLAVDFLMALAGDLADSPDIQDFLMRLVSSSDIVFAARIVNYSVGSKAIVSSSYLDGAAVKAKLRARLEVEFFATDRNIIAIEGRWALHPLYVAGDKSANTNYLLKILTDSDGVAKFLELFVHDRFGEPAVEIGALSDLVDLPAFTTFVAGVNLPDDAAGAVFAQKVLIARRLRETWGPSASS